MYRISIFSFFLGALLLGSVSLVFAQGWVGPTGDAPTNNVEAPINVGSVEQVKDGPLGVEDLTVFGSAMLNGSDRYLNFGAEPGDPGYGFRDNGGVMEYRNGSGGLWSAFAGATNLWSLSGSSVYYNDGNVGIGTSAPSQKLDVNGTVRATAFIYSSDGRLKEGVTPLKHSLAAILSLNPVSFAWKKGTPQAGEEDIGFIAQEVEAVVPETVSTDVNGMKSVDYPRLVPFLVRAIQEQQAEIESLKVRIEALEER